MKKARVVTDPTAENIRADLSEAIRRLNAGEITPAEANAVTRKSGKVLAKIAAGLRVARLSRSVDEAEGRPDEPEARLSSGRERSSRGSLERRP